MKKDEDSEHFDQFLREAMAVPGLPAAPRKRATDKTPSTLMLWPSLREGLKQRAQDEALLQALVKRMQQFPISSDEKENIVMSNTVSEILYGKGCTAQDRQDFLERYGCARSTLEALALIRGALQGPSDDKMRGIVEIGVGFGQWSRQLVDTYKVDIVAFDNMANLPLDPRIHHTKTDAYKRYFYQGKVRLGDDKIFQNAKLKEVYKIDGRALMIIFPDPSPMAIDCLEAYTSSSELNDLVIYVGEGRGGANASGAFFDELERVDESGEPVWELLDTCKLAPFGDKGFERLFIFKKRKCAQSDNVDDSDSNSSNSDVSD